MRITEYLKMAQALENETKALKFTLQRLSEEVSEGGVEREGFLMYLQIKADVSSRLTRLLEMKRDISSLIDKIENSTYRTLLTLRYINGETMEKCAEIMDYEERHIYRIHKKAVEAAEDARNNVDLKAI